MTQIENWLQEPPISDEMPFPDSFQPKGWVYVLSNPSMPGIFKIGLTTTHPEKRAKELSGTTGVPTKFKVVRSFISDDPNAHEKEIHRQLARYRINEDREFFQCPVERIIQICTSVIPDGSAITVNDLTDKYNLISFEKFGRLDKTSVMNDLGISFYGGEHETYARLATFGAEVVKHLTRNGGAVVFVDNNFTLLLPEELDEF